MVKKRICLISVLFLICLFLMYTSYHSYVINFWTQYPVSEKVKGEGITKADILDMKLAGEANGFDVDFFVYENPGNSSTNSEIRIYATDGAAKKLKQNHITDCDYKNPVIGKLNISVLPLDSIDKKMKVVEVFYTSDFDNQSLKKFSEHLCKEYGFNEVIEASPEYGINGIVFLMWAITFSVLILMLYYEILSERKEKAVIIALGGSAKKKYLLLNVGYLASMYIIVAAYCLIMRCLDIPFYGVKPLFYSIVAFSLAINIMQGVMSPVDFKRDLADSSNVNRLIKLNYGLRISVAIISAIIFIAAGWGISETIDLSQQRTFFEEHKDYDFFMIYDVDNEKQAESFYKEFKKDAVAYQKCQNYEPEISERCPVMFVNNNAVNEIASHNEEFKKFVSGLSPNKCNVLINKERYNSDNIEYIKRCLDFYGVSDDCRGDTKMYECNVSTVLLEDMMNNDGATRTTTRNPVIVIIDDEHDASSTVFASSNDTMYKISDTNLAEACKKHGWDFDYLKETKTNAYEGYILRYNQMKSVSTAGGIISILLFVTQLLTSIALLNLQYRIRSVEMVLMRITGYSDWNRMQGILKCSFVSLAILMIAESAAAIRLGIRTGIILWTVVVITAVAEVAMVYVNLKRADNKNMVGILKGGIL